MSVSTIIDKTTGKIYDYLYDKGGLTPTPTKGHASATSDIITAGIPEQIFESIEGDQLIYLSAWNFETSNATIINMEEDHVIKFMKYGDYKIDIRLNVKLVSPQVLTIPELLVVPDGSGNYESASQNINFPHSHNFQIQVFTKGTIDPITGVYSVGTPIGDGAFISVNSTGNHQLHLTEVLYGIPEDTEISFIGVAHNVDMKFSYQPQLFTMPAVPAIKVNIYEL